MSDRICWRTALTRANSISVSLRTTVPQPVLEAMGVSTVDTLLWSLSTIGGSVCAIVRRAP